MKNCCDHNYKNHINLFAYIARFVFPIRRHIVHRDALRCAALLLFWLRHFSFNYYLSSCNDICYLCLCLVFLLFIISFDQCVYWDQNSNNTHNKNSLRFQARTRVCVVHIRSFDLSSTTFVIVIIFNHFSHIHSLIRWLTLHNYKIYVLCVFFLLLLLLDVSHVHTCHRCYSCSFNVIEKWREMWIGITKTTTTHRASKLLIKTNVSIRTRRVCSA